MTLDGYPARVKKAASTVQRLRGWVGTDPSRAPELADALVRLTEARLRANAWTEAAPDAQESVVLAGKLLASHGPLGPYTPLADAVRFVTATVQLADAQVGLGLPEAAGRTLQAALAVRGQLSRLDLDHELDATTRCRALLVLAEVALERAGRRAGSLTTPELEALVDDCREAKERLAPQSKRIVLEVAGVPLVLGVDEFYAAATPLVEQSLAVMDGLVASLAEDEALASVAGIYLVGGGSGLPLVSRLLRQRFGRRVHRSPYPAASTAIGLAIAADPASGYSLTDRLSRGFGVFRERDAGHSLGFDQIFSRDEVLPDSGVLTVTRRYQAAHNLGWFRYVEYSSVDDAGEPRGDLVPFAEVLFPFDSALQGGGSLADVTVERREGGLVEERYTVDANGIIAVTITDLTTGYSQSHALGSRG